MNELLIHEYTSKKKGRGTSSIFLNKVGKGRTYKQRNNQNEGGSTGGGKQASQGGDDIMLNETLV